MPGFSSDEYQRQETGKTEEWLNNNVGFDVERTFAYPCGIFKLGAGSNAESEERFQALCQKTFLAARTAGGPPIQPWDVMNSRFKLPSSAVTWAVDSSEPGIGFCESALEAGAWGILQFHDVVDGLPESELQTRRTVHSEILAWLKDRQRDVWVAPLRNVYKYIRDYNPGP